ncbi:MAG: MarR family transcriptional regulator [Candidatus Dormibacteria bacterium]
MAELTERWVAAYQRLFNSLVRALPPRSKAPLRDLSLEQIDALSSVPEDGQGEAEFIAERGLEPEAGQALLNSLQRHRLVQRERTPSSVTVRLSERGGRCREDLRAAHRTALLNTIGDLTAGQRAALMEVVRLLSPDPLPEPTGQPSGSAGDDPGTAPELTLEVLVDRLVALRRGLSSLLAGRLNDEVSAAAGTMHQLQALGMLPLTGATMREFAELLSISNSSATALVDRMVRQGLLERQADVGDRRLVRVVPTVRALGAAQAFREHQVAAVSAVLGRLSERQLQALAEVADIVAMAPVGPRAVGPRRP